MQIIGEILIEKGFITREQLDIALQESKRHAESLGKALRRLKFISQEQLLQGLGEQLGLIYHRSLKNIPVSPEVIDVVPAKFAWHYKFMPLEIKANSIVIAVSEPLSAWLKEDLKLHLGFDAEIVLATDEEILAAIRQHYGLGADTVDEIIADKSQGAAQEDYSAQEVEELGRSAQDASVIKLVNEILFEAVNSRATDVHVEPYRDSVHVRYRIDGILYNMRMPEQIRLLHQAIVSRIKIISGLNVVERRLPQDGRAIVKVNDRQVDLRISIIPGIYGENVVIRILPVNLLIGLEELGYSPQETKIMEDLMLLPHGIIFITGPTGSGKTTTLYACLSRLNKEAVKIITIEDPIEYELPGVMQIQVKPEIDFTFANALRSILRHDPDIMMIGEVRDLETAELAIRTALTGHLIFSTLHTNDAPSGATRLLDIGIEPYLLASSVNAFISQRLVRLICPDCKVKLSAQDKELLPQDFRKIDVYKGKGCESCKFIGYRGRVAIYEILLVNEAIKELILKKSSSSQISQKAKEFGFKTLREAGIEKVRQGLTTPEEVLRVTESEQQL